MQGWAGVCATAAPAAFAFLAMAHRETLMDLNDEAGDRAFGVWTLPVVAGPRAALAAAAALLAGAAAVACGAALRGGGLAWVVSARALAWLPAGSAAPACQRCNMLQLSARFVCPSAAHAGMLTVGPPHRSGRAALEWRRRCGPRALHFWRASCNRPSLH